MIWLDTLVCLLVGCMLVACGLALFLCQASSSEPPKPKRVKRIEPIEESYETCLHKSASEAADAASGRTAGRKRCLY